MVWTYSYNRTPPCLIFTYSHTHLKPSLFYLPTLLFLWLIFSPTKQSSFARKAAKLEPLTLAKNLKCARCQQDCWLCEQTHVIFYLLISLFSYKTTLIWLFWCGGFTGSLCFRGKQGKLILGFGLRFIFICVKFI